MEHFIRIAFWIFTLSGSLQAGPLFKRATSDWNIDFMRANVTCVSDFKFNIFIPKCITTALDCVMQELLGKARVECDDPENRIGQALETYSTLSVTRIRNGHGLTDSPDCVCEKWPRHLKTKKNLSQLLLLCDMGLN
uniref:Interleukin n=1 Tax=Stegastes partitus TaxID=144197 RepID=A0A3B5A458_9TELE